MLFMNMQAKCQSGKRPLHSIDIQESFYVYVDFDKQKFELSIILKPIMSDF